MEKVGLVEINIEITANKEANEYYKNNYILEITGSYDMSKYISVDSDNAMITETGNSKTLMFIVLPGQSTNFNIKLGTDNFEMDGIQMAMVPLTGDLLNKVVELANEKEDMENAINTMNKSTDIILDSLNGMTNGLNGISYGVKEIKSGVNEIHGLNTLRDEDISILKSLLNEVIPNLENVQLDLDNLSNTYGIFIDLSDELNTETKALDENVISLDKDLKILESMAKDLPKDVKALNELLWSTEDVVDELNSLLEDLSKVMSDLGKASSSSEKEIEDMIGKIDTLAKTMKSISAQIISPEEMAMKALLDSTSDLLLSIEENLTLLSTTVGKVFASMPSTKGLSNDLDDLSDSLNKVSNLLDDEEAEIFEDTLKDTRKVVSSLENMLNIVTTYSDKLLENKDDFYTAITNAKELITEINEMDVLSISMISNLQTMLNTLSSSIYGGADKTTDSLLNVNNELIGITKESTNIKNSKNEIKDIVDNRFDEVEEKTTIFNIDEDAKVVSFGNSKNENVTSVQFLLKTPDIKNIKVSNDDMEKDKTDTTFWDRLLYILDKLFGWIGRIFS